MKKNFTKKNKDNNFLRGRFGNKDHVRNAILVGIETHFNQLSGWFFLKTHP